MRLMPDYLRLLLHTLTSWFIVSLPLIASEAEKLPQGQEKGLERIVVYAQKRIEPLSEVPVAINAYSGSLLNLLRMSDTSSLVEFTPSLSYRQQGGSNRNYFLRGVGTNDFHLTSTSTVGQYFDEVTLTSGFHAKAALFDMQRVEILKGPQNTLFGLNTTAGAINFYSNKPEIDGGTTGYLNWRQGNYSLSNFDGALGFDLSENLAARIAGYWQRHDGAFDSDFDGRDFGDDDTKAGRIQLLWQATDTTELLLNLHAADTQTNGTAKKAVGSRLADGSENRCHEFVNQVINFERRYSCLTRNAPNLNGGETVSGVNPSGNDWESIDSDLGSETLESHGLYLKISHAFGELQFVSISAFDNLEFQTGTDFDGSRLGLMYLLQEDDRDTFQQEFRLLSDNQANYRWIIGAFYLDEEADSFTGVRTRFPLIGAFRTVPNVQLFHTKENIALYGQGEYDLTDQITATLGIRWSDEEVNGDYLPSSPNVTAYADNALLFSDDIHALVQQQGGYDSERQVSQKINNEDVGFNAKLDYLWTPGHMLYGGFSRGYKGGALDIRAAFAVLPVENVKKGIEDAAFEPESLDAWELGYKGSFLDDYLDVDLSAFYYDYSNIQIFANVQGLPGVVNAPESEVTGAELDFRYANSLGFYAQAGISYLSSEVVDGGGLFVDGTDLSNVPRWSGSALVRQDIELGTNLLTLSANITYSDERHAQVLEPSIMNLDKINTMDSYAVVSASALYYFGQEHRYMLGLYVNNLFDEHYCSDIRISDAGALLGDRLVFPSTGDTLANTYTVTCGVSNQSVRTFGGMFSYNF